MAISTQGIFSDPTNEQEQTPETQEVKKAQEVIAKIRFVAFSIDFMKKRFCLVKSRKRAKM